MTRRILIALFLAAFSTSVAAEDAPAIDNGAVLGVGPGMTLAQARAAAPDLDWDYEPAFMVDLSADCAEKNGELLFCAFVYADDAFDPSARIEGIAVMGEGLKTIDGVHPGMTLAEAEKRWGATSLSFHYANEAREFIVFADGPDWISARGALPGAEHVIHVGVYPKATADQEFQETTEYKQGAVIGSLWLY